MMNVRSVAVLITLLSLLNVDALSQPNQVPDNVEFQVLKDLYDSLSGPLWKNTTNWPLPGNWPSTATNTQFRKWHGVTVIYGDVAYIDLSGNKLSGRLPLSIRFLTKLKRLSLSNNNITGELPPGLCELKDLVWLKLDDNKLKGKIPSCFDQLHALQIFWLSKNSLSGTVPELFGQMRSLEDLRLANNKFIGTLSPRLLTLPFLNVVYVDDNDLTSVPDFGSYVNRTNLVLRLQNNRLDFSQLEGNVNKGIRNLTQTPQKTINDSLTHSFMIGNKLILTSRPATANTTVIWEKLGTDDVTWSAVTNDEDNVTNTYTRTVATRADVGMYRWKATNSIITGVTIQSEPILVKTILGFALDNWCFQYKYDERRRVTHKKIPGADWTYMVYDDRDRLVMTQDGEQRKSNKWMVTKYDQLNRPVVTALYTHDSNASQENMADHVSKTLFAESYLGDGISGYTNKVFPATNLEILTATYYDDYTFATRDTILGYKSDQLADQYKFDDKVNAAFPFVNGKVTGMKVKVLDAPYYMTTVNYYDDHGRIAQTVEENYNAGVDRITNNYDFTGKLRATRTTHSVSNLHWENVDMMQVDGNFVKGTAPGKYGGGTSVEYLPASMDGWAEATVTEVNTKRYFGLSENYSASPDGIRYCFYLHNAVLKVLENGLLRQSIPDLGSGDRLRIVRSGGKVKFYRNGVLIYTSTTPSTTALRVNVLLFGATSTIFNLSLSSARTTQTALREFDYDHAGRLVATWHCVNNRDTVLLSKNEYNESGQLIDKKLYGKPGADFSQSIDYRYNIRGWLTSINGASVDEPTANDGDLDSKGDLFGIDLQYNDRLSGLGNTPAFNGNISAMQWRANLGLSDTTVRAYTFAYDPMNRLAHSSQKVFDGQWRREVAFYEDSLRYDLNGNIMSLKRVGNKGSATDGLAYQYGAGPTRSNQLLRVNDSGDPSRGFTDGNNVGDDYTYDRNGNMTNDNNKDVAISYNILDHPHRVLKNGEGTMEYYYDAMGKKLSQVLKDASGLQTKTTDYHGDFIYENDTLKFLNTEEGRVIPGDEPEYQFHLKDHLGNIRMTFTAKNEIETSTANLESRTSGFLYYDEAVKVNSELFDHTNVGETHYSARLNGSSNERIGLAKSLGVMPGDTIKMEVYAKYLDPNKTNWSAGLNTLITSIMHGTAAAGTFIDGGTAGSTGGVAIPWSGFLDKNPDTGPAPKAYLNYVLFDGDYNFIGGNAIRLSAAGREYGQDGPHERLACSVLIRKAGYVYIYLSNDNTALSGENVEVYFDDFKVEHIKSPVIQSQDYYPFGGVFNGWRREGALANRYQYTGRETQTGLSLDLVSYGSRMYSRDIGRWITGDHYSESYFSFSPYNFVRNNPILRIDPSGNWDITVHLQNDREQYGYGIAVVTDRKGNEIFRFAVRAEGTGGRDRSIQNSDTPLGVYDIPDKNGIWRESTNDNRQTYGPNPRLVMNPEAGEIVDTGRDAIRIHGGRQETYNKATGEWESIDNPSLKKTHGCLRVFDTDAKKLKDLTDELMANDPDETGGKVTVSGDLTDFLKNDGKDKEEQEKTKMFWNGFNEALGKGLDNLEQWLKANGFK